MYLRDVQAWASDGLHGGESFKAEEHIFPSPTAMKLAEGCSQLTLGITMKHKNELYLARDVKDSKERLYKYTGKKRKSKEAVMPFLNGQGKLLIEDVKELLLNKYFVLIFTKRLGGKLISDRE